jgi:hypothetical protein
MSNISKGAKRDKIENQIYRLRDQLYELQSEDSNSCNTMSGYFHNRTHPIVRYQKQNRILNIKKKISFLERKIIGLA